jgi:DNA-directed RNA polymerase subunit RPC12/RpoP
MFVLDDEGLHAEIPVPPPVVTGKPRITCPICGVSILKKGKKRHERSQRHKETENIWQERSLQRIIN